MAKASKLVLSTLTLNDQQPLRPVHWEAVDEMAEAIREHGVSGFPTPEVFEIDGEPLVASGWHYVLACREAGLTKIDVVRCEGGRPEALKTFWCSNIEHKALTFTVAEKAATILELLKCKGYSKRRVARELGLGTETSQVNRVLKAAGMDAPEIDSVIGVDGHKRKVSGVSASNKARGAVARAAKLAGTDVPVAMPAANGDDEVYDPQKNKCYGAVLKKQWINGEGVAVRVDLLELERQALGGVIGMDPFCDADAAKVTQPQNYLSPERGQDGFRDSWAVPGMVKTFRVNPPWEAEFIRLTITRAFEQADAYDMDGIVHIPIYPDSDWLAHAALQDATVARLHYQPHYLCSGKLQSVGYPVASIMISKDPEAHLRFARLLAPHADVRLPMSMIMPAFRFAA